MSVLEGSKNPETLVETTWRQNARRSLTYIGDKAFKFFVDIDKCVRQQETTKNLELYGTVFYEHV